MESVDLNTVQVAEEYVSFREQVLRWGGHEWRRCLEAMHTDLLTVLAEVRNRQAVFHHTASLRKLFLAWQRILDEIFLMTTGLLCHPTTVQDALQCSCPEARKCAVVLNRKPPSIYAQDSNPHSSPKPSFYALAGPPENTEEVKKLIAAKVSKGRHVIVCDQGKGLTKAYRELGLSAATAAHSRKEYSLVVKQQTKKIAAKALRFVQSKKRAKINSRSVTLVGGYQRCEALAGSMKKNASSCPRFGPWWCAEQSHPRLVCSFLERQRRLAARPECLPCIPNLLRGPCASQGHVVRTKLFELGLKHTRHSVCVGEGACPGADGRACSSLPVPAPAPYTLKP